MRTIIQRAAGGGAIRAVLGAHLSVTTHRAGQLHWCHAGDPTVVLTATNQLPLTTVIPFDMRHTNTVCRQLLMHLFRLPR